MSTQPRDTEERTDYEYTDEEIVDSLRRIAVNGEMPRTDEINRAPIGPCAATIYHRFGGLCDAAAAAGLAYEHPRGGPSGRNRQYSDEELLGWLQAFAAEFGVAPKSTDFTDGPGPSATTISQRFGSWADALDAARVAEVTD